MTFDEAFKISAVILASLGGGGFIVAAFASWLGKIWAARMLQNERAKHSETLEDLKNELNLLKEKDLTRHNDKLQAYRTVVNILSEILCELEDVALGRKESLDPELERTFRVSRNKVYGYISLVSSQNVMDKYNEMTDYLIPIIYDGEKGIWTEMRAKADAMLNAMREDLGITDGQIIYRGTR